MKKQIIFLLFANFLLFNVAISQEDFRKNSPKAGPAPKIELGQASEFILDNGMKVIIVENHKLPRVSFQLFVDMPPLQEKEFAGAADLAGQLLKTGTTSKSKADIDVAVDYMGASLSTSASGMFGSCLTKHKDGLLKIMQDVLLNPAFPAEEFEKLQKQTLSSLAQSKEDPNAIASSVGQVLRYGKDHPYGEIQTEETITNVTVEHCKMFYNTYFKPNISYLIIVGDINAKEGKSLAQKYFGTWKRDDVPMGDFGAPERPSTTLVDFVNKTGAVQSVVEITYPIDLKPGSTDAIKASVMNRMLGGFFSSRLNSNLREDKGYTYGARSAVSSDKLVGSFRAYASVRNEVTDSSIVEFLHEMNKMRAEAISDEELSLVKNVMTGSFARSLESPQTIARFALNTARYRLPKDYYQTYLQKVSEVTKEDILAMANKYVTPANAHILVVGSKDEVAEKLNKFATDGKVNYYDASGNPITDDGVAIPDGVTAETIIADYLNAIGGAAKVKAVNSVVQKMGAEMMGMGIEMTMYQQKPNKMCMETSMNGSVMQKMVFDGEKGIMAQAGQSQPMPEEAAEDMKYSNQLFSELDYNTTGFVAELAGIEKIEGKNAYKMIVTQPNGKKKTEYYDMSTSLKIREIKVEGEVTVTTDLSDYKEVSGIKFPHTVTVSGPMPVPMKMEAISIEVNNTIEASIFDIK